MLACIVLGSVTYVLPGAVMLAKRVNSPVMTTPNQMPVAQLKDELDGLGVPWRGVVSEREGLVQALEEARRKQAPLSPHHAASPMHSSASPMPRGASAGFGAESPMPRGASPGFGAESPMPGREKEYYESYKAGTGARRSFYDLPNEDFRRPYGVGSAPASRDGYAAPATAPSAASPAGGTQSVILRTSAAGSFGLTIKSESQAGRARVIVTAIAPDSANLRSGLMVGDELVAVGGTRTAGDYEATMGALAASKAAPVQCEVVRRSGQPSEAAPPSNPPAQSAGASVWRSAADEATRGGRGGGAGPQPHDFKKEEFGARSPSEAYQAFKAEYGPGAGAFASPIDHAHRGRESSFYDAPGEDRSPQRHPDDWRAMPPRGDPQGHRQENPHWGRAAGVAGGADASHSFATRDAAPEAAGAGEAQQERMALLEQQGAVLAAALEAATLRVAAVEARVALVEAQQHGTPQQKYSQPEYPPQSMAQQGVPQRGHWQPGAPQQRDGPATTPQAAFNEASATAAWFAKQ